MLEIIVLIALVLGIKGFLAKVFRPVERALVITDKYLSVIEKHADSLINESDSENQNNPLL